MISNTDDILKATFDMNSTDLPSIQEIKDSVSLENEVFDILDCNIMNNFAFKSEYQKHSFPILTKELIKTIAEQLQGHITSELACGGGWLTYWLRKYGLKIEHAVDNYSWETLEYQSWVGKQDTLSFVEENQDIELFILSWPYMNSMAADIWDAMSPGQILLYIGEGFGGCTADDRFHEMLCSQGTNLEEISDKINEKFVSFWGIHDRIEVIRKER